MAGLSGVKNVAVKMSQAVGLGARVTKDEALRLGSRAMLFGVRSSLQHQASRFLGDVFIYLKHNTGQTSPQTRRLSKLTRPVQATIDACTGRGWIRNIEGFPPGAR